MVPFILGNPPVTLSNFHARKRANLILNVDGCIAVPGLDQSDE